MSLVFIFIIFMISSASAANTTLANTCYDVKADFENACQREFGGVVDGGRCYFSLGVVTSNWSHWWAMCEQYGAIVAQVHTSSEYSKLETLIRVRKKGLGDHVIRAGHVTSLQTKMFYRAPLGMLDPDQPSQNGEVAIRPTAFWYDSATIKNTKLGASSTWVRTRVNDDYTTNRGVLAPRCFFIWQDRLVDENCTDECAVLCQITNRAQNYTLTNYCLQETAVEVFGATEPFQCAQVCSSRPWCRSFNYISNANGDQCQLFPWSINDDCTGCANRTQSTPTCSLYNYVI